MHVIYRQTCRVCGSSHLVPVLDLGEQFLQGSFIKDGFPTPPMRRLPLQLVRCDVTRNERGCGLLQLAHTFPPEVLYANYWYCSGTNATMRDHLRNLARSAVAFLGRAPLRVLDIGCNDGTLLRTYPEGTECWGVDPSDIARSIGESVQVLSTVFPSPLTRARLTDRSFDLVTSIAMYYDLESPVDFAREIKRLLSDDGVWVLEMSYLPLMLRQNSFDTICHEHLEYYSLSVLDYIMRQAGLKIARVALNDLNGGSICCHVVHDDDTRHDNPQDSDYLSRLRIREFELELDTNRPYESFAARIERCRQDLIGRLREWKSQGRRIHLYGASTKGNVLLQWYGIDNTLIECAADRNPAKAGARTLGTDIPIVDEETSRRMNPDYYLVLPWHFKREFLMREADTIRAGTRMVFPLPDVAVVSAENLESHLAGLTERSADLGVLEDPKFVQKILSRW